MHFDPIDFWSKVQKRSDNECWPWRASLSDTGYGQYKNYGAHVVAFTLSVGVFPSGRTIRHSCNNKACCNPKHLTDGTQKENIEDAKRDGLMYNPGLFGEMNGNNLLTRDEVKRIRELGVYFTGYRIARLPEFRGRISEGAIYGILRNRNWRG